MRAVRLVLLVLVGLVLVLALLAAWAVTTERGTRALARVVLPLTPVSVEAGDIHGRLIGPLALEDVAIDLEDGRMEVARIELEWRPARLLRGVVEVERLALNGARLALEADAPVPDADTPAPDDGPFELEVPLPIRVARLEVRDGTALWAGEPLVSSLQAVLALEAEGRTLRVTGLEAQAPRGSAVGHATLSTAADGDVDVDVSWRWLLASAEEPGPDAVQDGEDDAVHDPQDEELRGRLRAQGTATELDVGLQLEGRVAARVSARVHDLDARAHWDAVIELEPLRRAPALWPQTLEGASGRLASQGSFEDMTLEGALSMPQLIPGDVGVAARLGWANEMLEFRNVVVELEQGGRVTGEALLRLEEEPRAALSLVAEELRWPTDVDDPGLHVSRLRLDLEGEAGHFAVDGDASLRLADLPDVELAVAGEWRDPVLSLERVRFEVEEAGVVALGEAAAHVTEQGIRYEFEVDGALEQSGWPTLRLHASGEGDPAQVRLDTLRADLLEGTLSGAGSLAWDEGTRLELVLTAEDLNPGAHWARWPGRIGGEMRVRGDLLNAESVNVTVAPLEGQLRDRALRAGFEVQVQRERFSISRAQLQLGETVVSADGRLEPDRADMTFQIDSPDLEDLHPDASGALVASASLRGTWEAPVASLRLAGSDIRWLALGLGLEEVAASAELDLSDPREDAHLELALSGLHAGAEEPLLDRLTLAAAGTLVEHRMHVSGASAGAQAYLVLAGGLEGESLKDPQWSGRLEELLVGFEDEPQWRLRRPAPLTVSPAQARLAPTCLDGGILGETCAAARWHVDEGWQARIGLSDLDLRPLAAAIDATIVAEGLISADVALSGDNGAFEYLEGEVELTRGRLSPAGFPEETLLVWNRSAIVVSGDPSRAVAEAELDLAGHGGIEGRVQVGWNEDDPPLEGRLAAELTRPELITIFIPDLALVEGRIGAALDIGGTFARPALRGELSWREGAASLPQLGTRIEDIELHGNLSEEEGLRFTASARAGDGELGADGRFALPPEPLSGEARLWGTEALIVNLPASQVLVTPRLTLSYRENQLALEGNVLVPQGSLTAFPDPEAPQQVAEISPDEVVVGAAGEDLEEEAEGLEVRADVRVRVERFMVDAEGLEARVEGDVRVMQGPGAEPFARGEISIIDGSYTLFDQPLLIAEGRLLFSDTPVENPALDFHAAFTTDDVVVDVFVRGSLFEPEVTLASEPPMPEAEALSYLITGRGLHDLGADQTQIVESAANAVMMAGGELLARQVGSRLGFDAMGATGGAEPGSADLVIGLHLGSRLFVSYGVGLYEVVSAMRVRYRLTRRWLVEVISGDVSSTDFLARLGEQARSRRAGGSSRED